MEDLANVGRNYNPWKWWMFRRYAVQVVRHIGQLEDHQRDLAKQLDQWKQTRSPILADTVQTVQAHYQADADLCSHDTPWAIDAQITAFVHREHHWVSETRTYQRLLQSFSQLAVQFLRDFTAIDATQRAVNRLLEVHAAQCRAFAQEETALRQDYIARSAVKNLTAKYHETATFLQNGQSLDNPVWVDFLRAYRALVDHRADYNREYLQRAVKVHEEFFGDIDGKALDVQQRQAVLTDDDRVLVLAGAGSGKTLTIAAKVKFLVTVQGIRPEDILLISFTKKSAQEMQQRIADKLQVPITVSTFHKVGKEMIAQRDHRQPTVKDDVAAVIQEYWQHEVYQDAGQVERLLQFFGLYLHIPPDMEQFATLGDYYAYGRTMSFDTLKGQMASHDTMEQSVETWKQQRQTLQGEQVKSLEEVMIANFLFLHGVDYVYEQPYEHDTRDAEHRQYLPDFIYRSIICILNTLASPGQEPYPG